MDKPIIIFVENHRGENWQHPDWKTIYENNKEKEPMYENMFHGNICRFYIENENINGTAIVLLPESIDLFNMNLSPELYESILTDGGFDFGPLENIKVEYFTPDVGLDLDENDNIESWSS